MISKRASLTTIRIATLNNGTLTAKSREIADIMTRRKLDILCLQEMRWTGGKAGGKARNIGEGVKLYYSEGKKPRNGVAICLKEEWQDKIIEVNRKSDRIISMKLVTPQRTYNVISVYARSKAVMRKRRRDFGQNLPR